MTQLMCTDLSWLQPCTGCSLHLFTSTVWPQDSHLAPPERRIPSFVPNGGKHTCLSSPSDCEGETKHETLSAKLSMTENEVSLPDGFASILLGSFQCVDVCLGLCLEVCLSPVWPWVWKVDWVTVMAEAHTSLWSCRRSGECLPQEKYYTWILQAVRKPKKAVV